MKKSKKEEILWYTTHNWAADEVGANEELKTQESGEC